MNQAAPQPDLAPVYSERQIFEDGRYVFKLLSTGEKLYRYEFDPKTGEVVEIAVFKRVQHNDRGWASLVRCPFARQRGNPTPFLGTSFSVYASSTSGKASQAYQLRMVKKHYPHGNFPREMYFSFERFEKRKGRFV